MSNIVFKFSSKRICMHVGTILSKKLLITKEFVTLSWVRCILTVSIIFLLLEVCGITKKILCEHTVAYLLDTNRLYYVGKDNTKKIECLHTSNKTSANLHRQGSFINCNFYNIFS